MDSQIEKTAQLEPHTTADKTGDELRIASIAEVHLFPGASRKSVAAGYVLTINTLGSGGLAT